MLRRGGVLGETSWDEALATVAAGLRAAGPRTAVLVGGQTSNEEGYLLQRIARQALGSPHVDSRAGAPLERPTALALSAPELGAAMDDLDRADSILVVGCDPLHAMPILDLRLRKVMRRTNARVVIASERPTALDGGAEETLRYAPGGAAAFLDELAAELGSDAGGSQRGRRESCAGSCDRARP